MCTGPIENVKGVQGKYEVPPPVKEATKRNMQVTDKEVEELAKKPCAVEGLTPYERMQWVGGVALMTVLLPLTATTVAATVLWDALDRGFMGEPLDGVLYSVARWVNRKTAPMWKHLVNKEADAFIFNCVLWLGLVIPGAFFYCFYQTLEHGFNPYLCFAFHVFRLGPYFMNFAYTYTNCHKECHSFFGIFRGPLNPLLKNVFNWWIGLFYGVLPSSFAFGHAINHHKYNNGPQDVLSTSDKPRDSFTNFLCYLPRQFLYAINVTTVYQFIVDKEYNTAFMMNFGTAWYFGFVYLLHTFHTEFALWYALLPLGENVLLLACINWVWHGFLNHKDPEDDYVGSVTILEGPINVQEEDYHVIHHRYPGAHWETHAPLFKKDYAEGKYHVGPATMFRKTHVFEMFFLMILGEYDQMADRMFDPRGIWTHADKINALKTRLRTCWWGPRRNLSIKLSGKEVRK
eukprot:TRINITY_DN1800_c0_g1_i2.p2 TRINITY_DN1800_c0_g1~~TRINITY_DN1800_c0_g1_i2.p2  ORF type:complete len:459 (+),score=196.17 TRINITY_DN1800_c0_g1_i2:87-1463(+)